MLRNCFPDLAVEHWFGCHTTEPGFAGDIAAIEVWLIDELLWYLFGVTYSESIYIHSSLFLEACSPRHQWAIRHAGVYEGIAKSKRYVLRSSLKVAGEGVEWIDKQGGYYTEKRGTNRNGYMKSFGNVEYGLLGDTHFWWQTTLRFRRKDSSQATHMVTWYACGGPTDLVSILIMKSG